MRKSIFLPLALYLPHSYVYYASVVTMINIINITSVSSMGAYVIRPCGIERVRIQYNLISE